MLSLDGGLKLLLDKHGIYVCVPVVYWNDALLSLQLYMLLEYCMKTTSAFGPLANINMYFGVFETEQHTKTLKFTLH